MCDECSTNRNSKDAYNVNGTSPCNEKYNSTDLQIDAHAQLEYILIVFL